jgi:hypothetical protein
VPSNTPYSTTHRPVAEKEMRVRDFDDALRSVVQERKLRVWSVNPHSLRTALAALERVLGVRTIALDRQLIAKMEAAVSSSGGKPAVLARTDAAGPDGPGWPRLVSVAQGAADELAGELFPARAPLLLTQGGLLARYGLRSFVSAMVEASQRDDCEAIILLNPAYEGDREDVLNGQMPVTGLLPGQVGRLSRDWIRQQAAATAS